MAQPDFWRNHEPAEAISREAGELRKEIETFERLERELLTFEELCGTAPEACTEDIARLGRELETLERARLLSGPYDRNDAVILIQAGAGGDDAEDWAAMLTRMYQRYAEHRGWQATVLHSDWGAESGRTGRAGIKTVFFEVEGLFAYGLLKREQGVHRLVRISPFSSQELRHTSFALVEVLPKIKDIDTRSFEIPEKDLKFEAFRSSGPGGQNVNRRATAVRLTHLLTGLVVACQVERTQEANRRRALELLRSRLIRLMEERRAKELEELRGAKISPEWGRQARSYVLHPYTLVKDHRSQLTTSNIGGVLDGELDAFIEAELKLESRK